MVTAPEIMKGHKGESIYIRSWHRCQLEREKKTHTGVGHLRSPKKAIMFVVCLMRSNKMSNFIVRVYSNRLDSQVGGGRARSFANT